VDEEATAKNQAEADKQAAEEGNEGGADKMPPGGRPAGSGWWLAGGGQVWARGLLPLNTWGVMRCLRQLYRMYCVPIHAQFISCTASPYCPVLPAVMKTEYVEGQSFADDAVLTLPLPLYCLYCPVLPAVMTTEYVEEQDWAD
jgi:hypothetical protein